MNQGLVITALLALLATATSGCHQVNPANLWPSPGTAPAGPASAPPQNPGTPAANPLRVTGVEREFFWNQLIDTVDDYFRIESERRVQTIGGVVTEGQVETHYLTGATALEPWLWDSASDFELAHATLQSLRRRASIRVVPVGTGYDVHVTVLKELEDVDYPAEATPGSSSPRLNISLGRTDRRFSPGQLTLGWIGLGRDTALEQEILRELYARLYQQPAGPGYYP